MSTSIKRTSPSTLDDGSSPKAETSRSVKQAKLDTSVDVHETRIPQEDEDTNLHAETDNFNRRASLAASSGDADLATVLHFMKAKIVDLEAKLSHIQGQATTSGESDPSSFINGDGNHFDNAMGAEFHQSAPEEVKRKPAIPMLNRVPWIPFKNAYPDEDPYAIDVLMGLPKFYWQRRAEEREMKDRIETAKVYDAAIKRKAVIKKRENDIAKARVKAANGETVDPTRKEMPERIRINSQPLLAILADIASEKWTNGSKVMLRPYKFLVAYEDEIRERFEFLQELWAKRPKPDDATTSASAVTTYEPETLEDDFGLYEGSLFQGRQSDTSSLLSQERRARRKVDLTTTYDALQDLACLIEFMDDDLLPVIRQYDSQSTYPKIYFQDLWYLYQPGQWVTLDERRGRRFSSDAGPEEDKPASQPGNLGERVAGFWRVRKTVGGRPRLSPPTKEERNRAPSNEVTPLTVRCYRIDYDGDGFGPIWVDFDFQPWEGEKLIEQLEIVPVRLLKKAREKRELYVKRGKQFMELTVPQHRIHSGPLLDFHPSGRLFEHVSPGQRDVYGSVIVDFKETARTNPKMVMKFGFESSIGLWDLDLCLTEDYPLYIWEDRKGGRWRETMDEIYDDAHIDEHLKFKQIRLDPFLSRYENLRQGELIDGRDFGDDEYCLLPNRVCAYILQRRRFAILKLNCLRPQGPDSHNWDDLFLTRDNKETVKAQTMSHFRNKRLRAAHPEMQFDLNQEKGLGLIILLHGVPGVGKTSTAECVAQLLGKPLFPITCGDLGTSADQVETQLYEIFGKAEKWDCVLLLDEADVFLASRGKNDLKRNAVVSVFLRILELYTGILFLTTNRIGVLDEAFMSRIHTQLYYPPLEFDQSMKIWATNLKKLAKRKRGTMQINEDQILKFAKNHFAHNEGKMTRWNGRQIRNACQAAAALTEHEAFDGCINDGIHTPDPSAIQDVAILEVRHFQKVDNAMREFHEYMTSVCGQDFSGGARMRMERDDSFKTKVERDDDYEPRDRRYQEQRFAGHDPAPLPRSPKPDPYGPEEGFGSSSYGGGGGGGGGYGGPPRAGGGVLSPHDREQRSRSRFNGGGFPREQDRDRDRDRQYFP